MFRKSWPPADAATTHGDDIDVAFFDRTICHAHRTMQQVDLTSQTHAGLPSKYYCAVEHRFTYTVESITQTAMRLVWDGLLVILRPMHASTDSECHINVGRMRFELADLSLVPQRLADLEQRVIANLAPEFDVVQESQRAVQKALRSESFRSLVRSYGQTFGDEARAAATDRVGAERAGGASSDAGDGPVQDPQRD